MQNHVERSPGKRSPYIALAALFILFTGATNNDDKELIIRMQGEVLVVQRQIRDLQESVDKWQAKSETSLNNLGSVSETSSRTLSSIDDKLQRNEGSHTNAISGINTHLAKISEQFANNSQQFSQLKDNIDSLKQSIQNLDQRLKEQEGRSGIARVEDPETAFSQAYQKYKEGDYDSAINLFRNYLKNFSQTEKSADASFWIAESLSAQGKLPEALSAYDDFLAKYSNSRMAANVRLKRGLGLLRMERRSEGVEALKSVVTQYPGTQESELAKAELVRLGEAK